MTNQASVRSEEKILSAIKGLHTFYQKPAFLLIVLQETKALLGGQ